MAKGLPALVATLVAVAFAACGDDDSTVTGEREVFVGAVELVDEGPRGGGPITGNAELVVSTEGTAARIELAGLEAGAAYTAALHAEPCERADPGGPRFRFDPPGAAGRTELDLALEADPDGRARAEASVGGVVPDPSSRSIVIYRGADPAGGERIACASFA